MAEVLSYATPTTDGREVRRYEAWQRRMSLARKVRWWWLGVVALGFLVAAVLATGGKPYDEVRRGVVGLQIFVGGPGYVLIVTIGTCGRIWPIPFAVICGMVVFVSMAGLFAVLSTQNAMAISGAAMYGVVFSALWYLFALAAGKLELPQRKVDGAWDPDVAGRVEVD